MKRLLVILVISWLAFQGLYAAVGCDLNDPDRDVHRMFPQATSYKTYYVSVQQKGGKALLEKIEQQLGDTFTGLYETVDVPYTVYEIFKNKQTVGYIHGVNQKGMYGGIQIFLALDPKGVITGFYYQKMTNQAAKQFRSPTFAKQFIGLTYKDFQAYSVATGKSNGRIAEIVNPSEKAEKDFRATLRGVKKNLILMRAFNYIP